jgi:hypothetical protein
MPIDPSSNRSLGRSLEAGLRAVLGEGIHEIYQVEFHFDGE